MVKFANARESTNQRPGGNWNYIVVNSDTDEPRVIKLGLISGIMVFLDSEIPCVEDLQNFLSQTQIKPGG